MVPGTVPIPLGAHPSLLFGTFFQKEASGIREGRRRACGRLSVEVKAPVFSPGSQSRRG